MQTIYLDISNKGVIPTIQAKQGDVGRKFLAVITDSGTTLSALENPVFSVWYDGDSGSGNYSAIDGKPAVVFDGKNATVELSTQMLASAGDGEITLVMNDDSGHQIGVWNIGYSVESVMGLDSEEVENYYTALSETASNAISAASRAEQAAEYAEESAYYKQNKLAWATDSDIDEMFAGTYEGVEDESPEGEGDFPGGGNTEGSAFDYTKYGLPELALTGDVSAMTKDNAVPLNYAYGERSGSCTMKWQGSSSLAYPKKNYTIKFDNAFEAADGWGEQKEYCLKANWIDHSHARNIVSCKLWGQIVKSRANASAKLNALPNGGAIDGFPCVVTINGEYRGLYTFNIPKDGWMFGMEGEQATEVLTPALATWEGVNTTTFTYTPTTKKDESQIRKQSILSGGRLYIDFDAAKCKRFACKIFLFDSDGNPYKWLGGYNGVGNPCITPIGYIGSDVVIAGGDYETVKWANPGEGTYVFRPDAPFSVPIPNGCTALVQLGGWGTASYPDGTITPTWQDGIGDKWAYVWQEKGIVATLVTDAKEAIICGGGNDASAFREEFTNDTLDLEYATDEDNADWVLASVNRLVNACMNSDGTDLDTTIAKYLDWDSAIDYYIFMVLLCGKDIEYKNYLLATYDGTKWFFSAYDCDSTYGLYWNGQYFTGAKEIPHFTSSWQKALDLVRTYKKDELKARYAELRAGVMSEENVALAFTNFVCKIPDRMYMSDTEVWTSIPSSSASNLAQIVNWYRMRTQFVDKQIESM